MEKARKLRILVAKPGLDGHDRGARIVARAFRDAGFEVIYTGCHQTPEQIVSTAIQEDVDMIGLSILSGAHTYSFPRILELLGEQRERYIGGRWRHISSRGYLQAQGDRHKGIIRTRRKTQGHHRLGQQQYQSAQGGCSKKIDKLGGQAAHSDHQIIMIRREFSSTAYRV